MKSPREVKDKILARIDPYSGSGGEMFKVDMSRHVFDGGYVMIGWNTLVKILDEILEIKYEVTTGTKK